MKIIVITLPEFFSSETEQIISLFKVGLEILHLRKPDATKEEYEQLLQSIPQKYHERIMLHDFFELTEKYSVRGVHLNRRNPEYNGTKNIKISKSCHSIRELETADKYDYVFLSPIFDSISKNGYLSGFTGGDLLQASASGLINEKVIALGGIDVNTLPLLKSYKFGGIGVLGAIWGKASEFSVRRFLDLTPDPSPGVRGEIPTQSANNLLTEPSPLSSGKGSGVRSSTNNHHRPGYFTTDIQSWELLHPISKEYRKNMTETEKMMWELLRNRKTGYKIKRQQIVDGYIVDFICIEKRVVIEIDGDVHLLPEQQEKDKERTRILNILGYDVIRFTNKKILENSRRVFLEIRDYLRNKNLTPDPSPGVRGEILPRPTSNQLNAPSPLSFGEGSGVRFWRNTFPLQFITHYSEKYSIYESVQMVLEGGCHWIQLRMKDSSVEEIEKTALQIQPLCKKYDAVFLINDHVELCKKIKADGVHLGKNDMPPADARKILGENYIIGGTCNTFEEIVNLKNDVDYIGCGPFRYTTTKKNLAPVLGLDGYRNIVWNCRNNNINLPIVAIGGITIDDIANILQSGTNGIALSGTILNAKDPKAETERIVTTIQSRTGRNYLA